MKKNTLASNSNLFIFSDAPKDIESKQSVEKVRAYIKSINGFKKVDIIERKENFGLAKSIETGVTEIVNQYGKIIVLEDDIVTSTCFLSFMNKALDFYEKEKKVWHVSGWNYPIISEELGDTYFARQMNCWGWATWQDRWTFYEKNPNDLAKQFKKQDIKRFNLDGSCDFWSQVLENKEGRINTWATFWYASIFKKDGLCLNPSKSLVKNIGFDGSGVHCSIANDFNTEIFEKDNFNFSLNITESKLALKRIKGFYRSIKVPLYKKVFNRLKKIVKSKNLVELKEHLRL